MTMMNIKITHGLIMARMRFSGDIDFIHCVAIVKDAIIGTDII